jgi:hypothetical protein
VIFSAPSQLSKNFKLKDKIKELEKQSPIVYHIRCSEYDADYIRKTARIFQYRMSEHSSSNAGNKDFRAQRLFTSLVIEFKRTKILERFIFYSYLKYFSEKNARVSITASDVTQNIISESEPHIYR